MYFTALTERLDHLDKVFQLLSQANLRVKVRKCQFCRRETSYLGHVIGQGRIEPAHDKVAAIFGYPRPANKKEFCAFLGLAGYYRRFVKDFLTIVAPLTNLTKKRQLDIVRWTKDCEEAILKVADPKKSYILQTDASGHGGGALLNQVAEDGLEHPVAFASRKLLPREMKYSTIEKECLAIVWALNTFYVYLYGELFTIEAQEDERHQRPTISLVPVNPTLPI